MYIQRNNNIISELEQLSENIAKATNYSYTININNENSVSTSQYAINGDAFLANITSYGKNAYIKVTVYSNKEDYLILFDNNGEKLYSTNRMDNVVVNPTKLSEFYPVYDIIKQAGYSISTDTANGKECYLISTNNGDKFWIEKETGILVQDSIMDMKITYSVNTVKDSDILKPDTTGYTLIQNNVNI